jgi:hypothetical protein
MINQNSPTHVVHMGTDPGHMESMPPKYVEIH